MPTGYPSLTKNQKQEIEAMIGFIGRAYATTGRDLLVVLTQRRDGIYWSCLRNDGTGFIGSAYATTGFIGRAYEMTGFISRAYATTGRDLLVVLRNDGAIKIKSIKNFYYPKLFQFSF